MTRRAGLGPGLLVAAAVAAAGTVPAAEAPAGEAPGGAVHQRYEKAGVAVELDVEPATPGPLTEGEHVRVRLRFTDARTGQPYPGLYPGAWLDLLPPPEHREREAERDACRQKIESFLSGALFHQPELSLNAYYVLALNDDPSITVVDPLFGFGNTRLLDLVELSSPGADWALTEDGNRLFVSLPESGRVAVIDTATWGLAVELEVGPRPRRLALQPGGRGLWVAFEADDPASPSGVAVVDPASLRPRARIVTGRGPHDLAFSADGRWAFVTDAADGAVTLVDAEELEVVRRVDVGERPVSVAWSPRAAAAYVVDAAGAIVVVDPERAEPAARIAVEPAGGGDASGLGAIRFTPDGRLGFVLHPPRDEVHVVDAASNRLVQTADVEDEPNEIAVSDELAYVRHAGSDLVLMIPLDEVGRPGRPVPTVDFPGGQYPAGRADRPAVAAGIVQAPGASAVLVANPLDRAIYYYKEGMAAPMGHFRNYGRQPRAVLVVDRSLREVGPGSYETAVRLTRPGDYDLALFLDAPRLLHCFPLSVAASPRRAAARARRPVAAELVTRPHEVAVGEEVRVRYRLTSVADGSPRRGVDDATVLAFLAPGITQDRHPAAEVEPGVYEARLRPEAPGVYYAFLEVPSAPLPLQETPYLVFRARPADPAEATPAAGQGDSPARETSSTNSVGTSASET